MAVDSLFQTRGYREYLRNEFPAVGRARGRRAGLAKILGCQTSFISQVLTDRAHLSLEHAIRTTEFLDLSPLERKYFMLLVQMERAGTAELQDYFKSELSSVLKKRDDVGERISIKTDLGSEDQMIYYSAWYYSAIHVLCAFPEFDSAEAIAVRLKIETTTAKKALRFLESRGFVKSSSKGFMIGETRIHLGKGSPMLPRHHSNWRMKAIEKVDGEKPQDLHYSAVLGISRKDVKALRDKLLLLLQGFEPVVKNSKVEEPVGFLIDLFSI